MTLRSSTLRSPLSVSPAKIALGVIGLLAAVVLAVLASVQVGYAGRVYPGVEVMGVKLGGMTVDEAATAIQRRGDAYLQSPLNLKWEDRVWRVTPSVLGHSIDAQASADRAFQMGREGNAVKQAGARIAALGAGGRVDVISTVDEPRLQSELAKIGGEVKRTPQNAGLVVTADGAISLSPSRAGVSLDLPRAVSKTRVELLSLGSAEIALPSVAEPATLTESELATTRDRVSAIVSTPLTVTADGRTWVLEKKDLAAMVTVRDESDKVVVTLDETVLSRWLSTIASDVKRSATQPSLKMAGGKVELIAGVDGQELDVESSRTMLLARLGESNTIPLVVTKLPAPTSDNLASIKTRLDGILSGPVSFKFQDTSWSLAPNDLASMLVIGVPGPGDPTQVKVDGEKFAAFAKVIAQQVNRDPRDARFRFEGGQAKVIDEAKDGQKLDVAKTQAALENYLAKPGTAVTVAATATPPAVKSSDAASIVVRDLIMESSTPYAGSIAAKLHNIQLATSRLNGTVVPPGGVFSFNRALGPATLASGFKLGYGIAVDNKGQMQTIPSEAGGICQVASTLFHSVFWAGYPIVERNWHMYWIPKYGQPPRGLTGLDATVDDGYLVDFQFKNNTGNWVVVEAGASDGYVRFALRGIKPDWDVKVGKPIVTNVVKANRTMVYELDKTMSPGQSLMVEAAEDGFDVSIDRSVTRGGAVVDHWVAKAHYRPSRNVTLVGTLPAAPAAPAKAEVTGTPGGTGTPASGTPAPGKTPGLSQPPTATSMPTKAPAAVATPTPKR